jgi:hypothetical protein
VNHVENLFIEKKLLVKDNKMEILTWLVAAVILYIFLKKFERMKRN